MTKWSEGVPVEVRVVPSRDRTDPKHLLWWAVTEAVRNATYKFLSNEAQRNIVDSILASLGYEDTWDEYDASYNPYIGSDARLKKAVADLLSFAPEAGYAPGFGEFAVQTEDCKFYFDEQDGEGYQAMVDAPAVRHAEKNGLPTTKQVPTRDGKATVTRSLVSHEPMPFFSQPIYYAVLGGKHDGRTLGGRIREVREAAGLDDDD